MVLFTKNLLGFIKKNWICESKDDGISLECLSNVSNPDVKQVYKGIFRQLNLNSIRNKFDILSELFC